MLLKMRIIGLDIEAMGRDPKTGIQYGMNYLDLDVEGQAVVKASPSLPLEHMKQLVITVSEHKNYKQPSYLNAEMGPKVPRLFGVSTFATTLCVRLTV
jgi:hypothetical protein